MSLATVAASHAAGPSPVVPTRDTHLDAARLKWRNIGPAVAGGRVAALAGTDADPLLYFFGAAGGGVFRSTNGGLTWTDVWPITSVGAIGALAIASYGDGVWVSHDSGEHWHHAGLPATAAISRIFVDPHQPNIVLVGALGNTYRDSNARGVFRTVDGGHRWQRTLYVGPQSGISDLASDPRVVYAGVGNFAASRGVARAVARMMGCISPSTAAFIGGS